MRIFGWFRAEAARALAGSGEGPAAAGEVIGHELESHPATKPHILGAEDLPYTAAAELGHNPAMQDGLTGKDAWAAVRRDRRSRGHLDGRTLQKITSATAGDEQRADFAPEVVIAGTHRSQRIVALVEWTACVAIAQGPSDVTPANFR